MRLDCGCHTGAWSRKPLRFSPPKLEERRRKSEGGTVAVVAIDPEPARALAISESVGIGGGARRGMMNANAAAALPW